MFLFSTAWKVEFFSMRVEKNLSRNRFERFKLRLILKMGILGGSPKDLCEGTRVWISGTFSMNKVVIAFMKPAPLKFISVCIYYFPVAFTPDLTYALRNFNLNTHRPQTHLNNSSKIVPCNFRNIKPEGNYILNLIYNIH